MTDEKYLEAYSAWVTKTQQELEAGRPYPIESKPKPTPGMKKNFGKLMKMALESNARGFGPCIVADFLSAKDGRPVKWVFFFDKNESGQMDLLMHDSWGGFPFNLDTWLLDEKFKFFGFRAADDREKVVV